MSLHFSSFPHLKRGARPMDNGKSKCWVTGHALGEHSFRRLPIQTGLPHEQHLAGKVLCLNGQAKHAHAQCHSCCKEIGYLFGLGWFWSPHQHLARTYDVSKAAVSIIIHDAVFILCKEFVLSMIAFPEGDDLSRVIHEFSSLCSLPCCAGAMNGTFMKIDGKLRSHANGVTLNFVARSTWLSYYLYVLVRESPSPLQDTGASMHWAPPACSCLSPLCMRFGLAGAIGRAPLRALGNYHAPP